MSKRLAILAGIALTVTVLGAAVAVPALAQEPTPKAPSGCRGLGFWGRSWAVFDAAAEALGLTPEQLFAELHSGKSLADIAETQGVDLKAVHEAMKAAQAEAMKQAIQQAVENGRLTQAQADWLLEGIDLGFLPRRWGFGRGVRGRFGGFALPLAPSAAPGPSSP